jgi:hypothetical protein
MTSHKDGSSGALVSAKTRRRKRIRDIEPTIHEHYCALGKRSLFKPTL